MKDEMKNYSYLDTLLENSLGDSCIKQSNLIKDNLPEEYIKETNSVANITNYRTLLTNVIKRQDVDSDLKSFCSVIAPITGSSYIPLYGEKLVGKYSAGNRVQDDIKVLKLSSVVDFIVGSTITIGTATAEVLYIEPPVDNLGKDISSLILVKVLTGTFVLTNTVVYPSWIASTLYTLGEYAEPVTPNGRYYKVTASGTSASVEPIWPTTTGATVTDSYPSWAASTAYTINQEIQPVTPNGRHYKVTTAGTSGLTEPIWPTTTGGTVTDGTVVFTDAGQIVTFTDMGLLQTLDLIFSNVHGMNQILPNYSGDYSTVAGETLSDEEEIDFELILKTVDCTTKTLKTGITKEALFDLLKMYGLDVNSSVVSSLSTCISEKTRQRIFAFMRNNAVARPDIVLTNSYGTAGGIANIFGDIYARVMQSIGKVGTATGISAGKYCVVASSNVVAALITHLKDGITQKDGINMLPGGIPLIEDGYYSYDYLLVALNGPMNNSAVIHTPYDIYIASAVDSVTLQEKIIIKVRNTTVNNPLMDLSGSTVNEMMEFTFVDMSGLTDMI